MLTEDNAKNYLECLRLAAHERLCAGLMAAKMPLQSQCAMQAAERYEAKAAAIAAEIAA